jgi:hypothetical protein
MVKKYAVMAAGCMAIGVLAIGCKPPADLSTTSAAPDEYVLSVPGMT